LRRPMFPRNKRAKNTPRKNGFTLAELLVAASLLSIVMAAVYVAFGSTLRVWRTGESDTNQYQDARIGLNLLSRELGCLLGGSEHLFSGDAHELEFFAVTPSLDVEEGEGARLLWIRYYLSNRKLYRQEAAVEAPLPLATMMGDKERALGRIKLGRKRKYEIAADVRGFNVEYVWVPIQEDRRPTDPPIWMDPILLKRSEKGWGLPQGVTIKLALRKPDDKKNTTDFLLCKSFRCPTTTYNEELMGKAEEAQ
jgi:prepilin-type N-terminal cleavage/methylation domain-containing protein